MPAKKKADRCKPIRDHIAANRQEIADAMEDVNNPEIPIETRRRLRVRIQNLRALNMHLLTALGQCEAVDDDGTELVA